MAEKQRASSSSLNTVGKRALSAVPPEPGEARRMRTVKGLRDAAAKEPLENSKQNYKPKGKTSHLKQKVYFFSFIRSKKQLVKIEH